MGDSVSCSPESGARPLLGGWSHIYKASWDFFFFLLLQFHLCMSERERGERLTLFEAFTSGCHFFGPNTRMKERVKVYSKPGALDSLALSRLGEYGEAVETVLHPCTGGAAQLLAGASCLPRGPVQTLALGPGACTLPPHCLAMSPAPGRGGDRWGGGGKGVSGTGWVQ